MGVIQAGVLPSDKGSGAKARTFAFALCFAVVLGMIAPSGAWASSAHHQRQHSKHVTLKGLVVGHHGRTMTVFAKTATIGKRTRHNVLLHVTLAKRAHGRANVRTGNIVALKGTGRSNGHNVTIDKTSTETVTPAPATLFLGTVQSVNGTTMVVTESRRDNGDGHEGDGDSKGGDGKATAASSAARSHDGGDDGDEGDGDGHQLMVDISQATVTADGEPTTVQPGQFVAVLGEHSEDTVLAADVFVFSQSQDVVSGKVVKIDNGNVTLRRHGDETTVALGEGTDQVPLVINGNSNALVSQLTVGDKLVVLGSFDSAGTFTPVMAFSFNENDDHPAGDNPCD
jgi:hypothetical protein